jgi:PilZ domain
VNPDLGLVEVTPHLAERRRFRRYHYSAPVSIHSPDGVEIRGMSMEISEGGISLLATASLSVGDLVELEPIGGEPAKAILRRIVGKLYGFEFLGLNSLQLKRIRRMCKMLPPFQSKTLDVWKHRSRFQ